MPVRRATLAVPIAVALLLGLSRPGLSEEAGDLIFLEQRMSDADRDTYSWTSLGSQLVPYSWFLALEDPETGKLFRDDAVLDRYGFPPSLPASKGNPDGLPRGFVKDGNKDWFGLPCAACHSTEITYEGKRIHVDGGPAMADIDGWGNALNAAMKWTLDDPAAFQRFATRVLGENPKAKKLEKLKEELAEQTAYRLAYGERNAVGRVAGMGRHDSFGVLYNTAGAQALHMDENRFERSAPVSLPHTWGVGETAQWNGFSSMVGLGMLGRDIGVAMGVFSRTDVEKKGGRVVYKSSIRTTNLIHMGKVGRSMTAPKWPSFFPEVNADLAKQGEPLFAEHCSSCHGMAEDSEAVLVPIEEVGTDPAMALQFTHTIMKTGPLEGTPSASGAASCCRGCPGWAPRSCW